ncbi:MAG: ORF6N domain-containing protein [Muribaculaceae bacterium]|nr:ORF6N domain-containing protein [Muribaculaceae bacterium]
MNELIKISDIEASIIELRNQRVLLDSDVARLYGVETREVNQAIKNNPDKFPEGYIIELTKDEKKEVVKNFDNPNVKFSPRLPKAFTEKGLYMLATILKSPTATQTTIAIVETFAKMRELSRTVGELASASDEFSQKSLMQLSGEILADLLDDGMHATDTETTIELNFAVLKLKHTVKRKK